MGIEDSDWHRDAQRAPGKQCQLDDTRARFSTFSRQHLGEKPISPTRTGLIPMMVFWRVVMGLLYLLMTHYLKPSQAQVLANGNRPGRVVEGVDIAIGKNQMVLRAW